MRSEVSPTAALPGLLLLKAAPSGVRTWLNRGTVPAHVVGYPDWTVVVPAADPPTGAPYDDGLRVSMNRPVPRALRPSLGLFVMDARVYVVARAEARSATARWGAWDRDAGTQVLPDHPALSAEHLVSLVGGEPSTSAAVAATLARTSVSPARWVRLLLDELSLPGSELLDGGGLDAREDLVTVRPSPRHADRFDRQLAEESEVRAVVRTPDDAPDVTGTTQEERR